MDLPPPDLARGAHALVRRMRGARRRGSSVADHVPPLAYAWRYARWRARCVAGPSVGHPGPERATAVLLSFARPANLAPIVAAVSRCRFVERIHVVNHHPAVRIRDWVRSRDPRVVLADVGEARPPLGRYATAREDGGERFVLLDDDLFLSPGQIATLFRRLVEAPRVPHGMYGQRLPRPDAPTHREAFENQVHGAETEVDVLNRAYFVTRDHVERLWRLHDLAAREAPDLSLGSMDDVLLSLAAPARPRIHDIGPFLDCPSQGDPKVAVWARPGIGDARLEAVRRLEPLRARLDARPTA